MFPSGNIMFEKSKFDENVPDGELTRARDSPAKIPDRERRRFGSSTGYQTDKIHAGWIL
jgi:hypothetical protein